MKKIFKIVILTAVLLSLFFCRASALESNVDSYKDEFGFDEAFYCITDETRALLQSVGLDEVSFDSVYDVSLKNIVNTVINIGSECIYEPLRFLAAASAIAAVVSVFSSFLSFRETAGYIGGCALALVCAVPAAECVSKTLSVLKCLADFSAAFAGAYCAVISACGNVNNAVGFSSSAVMVNTVLSQLSTGITGSVLNILCASAFLSCCDIFSFALNISMLVKKVSIGFLGFAGTVFAGILSLKDVLADSADSLASRGVRFLVGKSVPVVGGVVSESFSAFRESIVLIKNTAGVFGIAAMALTVLPSLVSLGAWSFAFLAAGTVCESFGCGNMSGVMRILRDTVIIAIAVIAFSTLIFTVCVGVTLKGGG